MSDDKKVITIGKQELDPSEAANYQRKISNARSGISDLKGSTPLGHVPKMENLPLLTRQQSGASPMSDEGGVTPRPPGSPVIRPETAQQLAKLNEAQKEEAVKVEESIKKEVEESKEDMFELFEMMGSRNEAESILNNKVRRKEIESRLEPMKLEDLILRDEVSQDVHIIKDRFWVRFRSMTPQESLFIKRKMADEKTTSDQYLMEKYSLFQLVCGLVSINGVPLPTHLGSDGEPTDDDFKKKYKAIIKKPVVLLADMATNYYWFDIRVRRLLNPVDLKNG